MRWDWLLSVLTLVIYFGAEEWDGPISIYEMFGEMYAEVLFFVPDYRMDLLAPALILDSDFGRLQSSLNEVLFPSSSILTMRTDCRNYFGKTLVFSIWAEMR